MEIEQREYLKRSTLGDCHNGVAYQRDLTIVIMLGAAALIKDGTDLEFIMTCENRDCGLFDDIGFRFKIGLDCNIWTRLLIQAKYTQKINNLMSWKALTSTKKKAPFAISKYYASFCSITKKMCDESKRNKTKNGQKSKDDLILVLCTNRSLQKNVIRAMNGNPSTHQIVKHMFVLLSAQHYKFNANAKDVRERLIKVLKKKRNILNFLSTFILVCETISQETLQDKIEKLLIRLSTQLLNFTLRGNLKETQYDNWSKFVTNWIYDEQGKPLYEDDINMCLIHSNLKLFSDAYEVEIGNNNEQQLVIDEKTAVKWEDDEFYEILKDWFTTARRPETVHYHKDRKPKIVDCHKDPKIVSKIIDKLKEPEKSLTTTNKKTKITHLFLKRVDFLKFKDQALYLFYNTNKPFILVIDCTDSKECNVETGNYKENEYSKMIVKIGVKKDSLFLR